MINERSSAQQANATPTSTNMQYGYPTSPFDFMNVPPMQNPNDVYSYYPPSLYQQFGTFDEHNQWASNDTSTGVPQFHPQMYTPTGLDIPRSPFEYPPPPPPPHGYPHYHPAFTPSSGASAFDMSWNSHNLSIQQQMQAAAQQQQMPPIGVNISSTNKKSTIYDDYPSSNTNVGDMLAQQMNSVDLGINERHSLSSREQQQQYQTNSTNLSLTRPSGPKSYASVVSSDRINSSIPSISNTQQQSGNNSRYQQSSANGNFFNWTTNNSERSSIKKNSSTRSTNGINQENNQYNPKDFNLNPKGARFFVIKSYSEDDVHRSIKYNIWCSTEHGNKRLDNAFREREGKGPIYLFFSVNASGHFCGMAEMMSPIDYEHQTDVWHMSNKWQGKFEVKWIYVKDVPNQQFRNIRLENNENKPVTNSRDTQEIPYEKGKLMLKTLHMYKHNTSIFDDFQYYESKQAEEVTTKTPSNNGFNNRRNRTQVQTEEQDNENNDE